MTQKLKLNVDLGEKVLVTVLVKGFQNAVLGGSVFSFYHPFPTVSKKGDLGNSPYVNLESLYFWHLAEAIAGSPTTPSSSAFTFKEVRKS